MEYLFKENNPLQREWKTFYDAHFPDGLGISDSDLYETTKLNPDWSEETYDKLTQKIKDIKVRFQKVIDLPPKDLRKLVDNGKKELGDGIIIVFATNEDKVGLAVGITEKLIDKYDAVQFAKLGSETIGGKGGGGRKDFAQAGGQDHSKIDEAFEKIKSLI